LPRHLLPSKSYEALEDLKS